MILSSCACGMIEEGLCCVVFTCSIMSELNQFSLKDDDCNDIFITQEPK